MARKREERAVRSTFKKEKKAQKNSMEEENFHAFHTQLAKMQLQLRDIPGDGNCLFRALGDQLEGHGRNHFNHRQDVVEYILEHRADFEPFVEDDVPFDRHIANLKKQGTYAGNDAIVAFARLHKVVVVIHQLNSPCLQIHGSEDPNGRQIHISYHNGDHYGSVRTMGDNIETPANIKFRDGVPIEKGSQEFHLTNPLKQAKYTASYAAECLSSLPEVGRSAVSKVYKDFSQLVWEVTNSTGCEDEHLVETVLKDNNWNVDFASQEVLQLMDTGYSTESGASLTSEQNSWGQSSTSSQVVNSHSPEPSPSYGAKPKEKPISAREKKMAKKKRAEERHRAELGTRNDLATMTDDLDNEATFVTQHVGVLQI